MAKSKKNEKASSSKNTVASKDGKESQRKMGAFNVLRIGSHYCYMKAHDGEDDRTMFLVNLPPDTTAWHFRSLFKDAGELTSVKLWKPNANSDLLEDQEVARIPLVKGKGVQKKVEGPPAIIPLPSLDPRGLHHLLPTATNAHITFSSEGDLQKALSMSKINSWPDRSIDTTNTSSNALSDVAAEEDPTKHRNNLVRKNGEERILPTGLDYLFARHRSLRPSLDKIKIHVDSVIANYDYRRAHPEKKKSGIQVASIGPNGELLDEDGFIIVQSTGKYGRTSEGQIGASIKVARRRPGEDLEDEAAREKKKKKFELEDFYRFQRREQKREELANLRAKFKEDQEKVQKLKSSRSFKPF